MTEDWRAIRRAEDERVEEVHAQRALALKLIDIGYKIMAKDLRLELLGLGVPAKERHPDKTRLKQARDRLRKAGRLL